MIAENKDGIVVIELGDGDVIIDRGISEDDGAPIVVFTQSEVSGEIGASVKEPKYAGTPPIMLVIKKMESLKVLEWALDHAKSVLQKEVPRDDIQN